MRVFGYSSGVHFGASHQWRQPRNAEGEDHRLRHDAGLAGARIFVEAGVSGSVPLV